MAQQQLKQKSGQENFKRKFNIYIFKEQNLKQSS